MKVSLNWLKEYISIDSDSSVIAEKLTMAGLEVETIEKRYDYQNKIVVAKVIEVSAHPNADKLTLCRVDVGTDQVLQIVCGAPNVKEGMYVPCALEGAILPGDFKIKAGKIRGELSKGMLCSAGELKLSSESSGIMELKGNFQTGTPLETALKLSDSVFDIGLTPNRPDCLNMIGVAREIAAFSEPAQKVKLADYSLPETHPGKESIHSHAKVIIEDPELCPRYTAGLLFNVKIGPSPFWLQDKLESIGLTPVNNVVDVTNFVMMETGQPLHAFDFDRLAKGTIIVRRAGNDKEFTTLDSKAHKLEPDMLMICDGERPVALAGIMGGENSEITENTTNVLIESAWFNPISIRKTAKLLGISTDASHRFERGTDPEGTVNAMKRSVSMIASLCDAEICPKLCSDFIDEYPAKYEPVEINLDVRALNVRLGTNFDTDAVKTILESVEFKVEKTEEDTLVVGVPSFRVDVTRPEDLSEEVARIWGYNLIQTSYPLVPAKAREVSFKKNFREELCCILSGFSLSEVINYNFIHENSCDRLNLTADDERRQLETILNPISDQMSVLRPSMIPGLLEVMKKNIAQQTSNIRIFEIGKVFRTSGVGKLPHEKEMLAGLLTGSRSDQTWYSKKSEIDFYDLKGVVEGLLDDLKIQDIMFEKIPDQPPDQSDQSCPYYKKGYAAFVLSRGTLIGTLGKIDTKVLKNFGLKQDAFIFDFNLDSIRQLIPDTLKARSLPKFPSISMDLTIIVDQTITVGEVQRKLEKLTEKDQLIEQIFLFDIFQGAPLTAGKKSLSFRIVYRSETKTLKEKKILKHHQNISRNLIKEFDADLPAGTTV
jgi:phenylalanyl-tRNA synthetase beta chain